NSTMAPALRGALSRSNTTALRGSDGFTSKKTVPRSLSYGPMSPKEVPAATVTRDVISRRVTRASAVEASTLRLVTSTVKPTNRSFIAASSLSRASVVLARPRTRGPPTACSVPSMLTSGRSQQGTEVEGEIYRGEARSRWTTTRECLLQQTEVFTKVYSVW